MDLLIASVHLLILFCSLFLFILYKQKSSNQMQLPPGSNTWPIVGENLMFLKAARQGIPEKFVSDRMSKYSPKVFRTSLLGQNVAVLCGALGNKFMFRSENKYISTSRPLVFLKTLLIPEDNAKDPLTIRAVVTEFLKPEASRHHIPITDSMAREHLEKFWCPCKELKAYPIIKKFTFGLASRLLLSITDPNHVTRLYKDFALLSGGVSSVPINFPGTSYYRALKGRKSFVEELISIVKQRKIELLDSIDTTKKDFLTLMLVAPQEEIRSLREREVAERILGLFIASNDTISTTLTSVLKFLAEHHDVYEKVFNEQMDIVKSKCNKDFLTWEDVQKMKYTWCVACEAMRLLPPGQAVFREAITDFTYAGYTIPKGWMTCWSAFSTHKNPKYFSDPEKFDPSRFDGSGPAPYTFVPFGGGARICPGREYARSAIVIFMHNLITKLKWEKVFSDEKVTYNPLPTSEHGLVLRLQQR